MLSNLLFRFQQLITRWLYRNHKRRYKHNSYPWKGQDD